jgi:hypothetical protein
MYIKGDKKLSSDSLSVSTEASIPITEIRGGGGGGGGSGGLQEVNMNESIHTGNPKF